MKKFAMLLAAGVIALGASAQAAPVESVTYAVVTVPVVNGHNFIGISVAPIDGTADSFATILGVSGNTEVSQYAGSGYTDTTAGEVTANLGSAVLYDYSGVATNIYEVGIAQGATATVALSTGFTLVANPFAEAWTPDQTDLNLNSYKRWGAKANKIHIWDATAEGWVTVWYKAGTGWVNKVSGDDVPTIGAGQAVLIEKGDDNNASVVTFSHPAP